MTNNIPKYPKSYWIMDSDIPNFPSLKESVMTDITIVGGGITGITTAYLLASQGRDVILIDAGSLFQGTTGHTTAKVTAQHGLIYNELIDNFGLEKAHLYYKANKEALKFIKQTISNYSIDCDFRNEDAYLYTQDEKFIEKIKKEQIAYEKIGIEYELLKELPLNLPIRLALKMKDQAQFHPIKYLSILVKRCLSKGVQFFENTTAIDIEYTKNPVVITRNHKRIHSEYVICASHYPFYDGQGFYPTRMYADRSYVLAIKCHKKYPGGMYINAESPTRSIRATHTTDGEQLWFIGGESHKVGQGEPTFKHHEALRKFAKDNFPVDKILYRWSAQDLITLDKLPYIGPITKNQEKVLIATGFRKWGMTTGTMAAKLLKRYIMNSDLNEYQKLFSPSRKILNLDLKNFIKYNVDVAKHLIKGKLEYVDTPKNIKRDEAKILRIKGKRAGAYRDQDNKLHIVDTTCTHLGCEINWNSSERSWDCPCHGSRFSYTGEVLEGPAKEPLEKIDFS